MFSGIVEDIGIIRAAASGTHGKKLSIEAKNIFSDLKLGDSVAVNGVCLTVVNIKGNIFNVDVSFETLSRSTIGSLNTNDKVNLERALKLSERLSGHIVLGHVDSKGKISKIEKRGDFYAIGVSIDDYVYKYCINKGSVAVDGISLTISKLAKSFFEVAVIPHTFKNTTLQYKKLQDYVNIETDVIGKYVEKLLGGTSSIDENFLKENGFA